MPGVANSIAQQEALYREYLNAQMQQNGNGQKVNQANSRTGCGVENQGNQCHTALQILFRTSITSATYAKPSATDTCAGTNKVKHFCT